MESLIKYFLEQENLTSKFEFWKSKLFKKFLKSESTDFVEFLKNLVDIKINWIDYKADIKTEWWCKMCHVNSQPRFKLICDKNIKIYLIDLENNSKIEIKEGTISAGQRKVIEVLL